MLLTFLVEDEKSRLLFILHSTISVICLTEMIKIIKKITCLNDF